MSEQLRILSENSNNSPRIASNEKPQESIQNNTNISTPIHEKIDEIAQNFKDFPVIGDIIHSLAQHLKWLVDAIKWNTNFNLESLKTEISNNPTLENAKWAIWDTLAKWLSYIIPTAAAATTIPMTNFTNENQENEENWENNPRRGKEISDKDAKEWVNESKLWENYKTATEFFVKKWLTLEQSIGIVANLHHESRLRTNAVGDNGKAKGIAQWHPDRRQAILKGTGINVATAPLEQQLEGLWWEITKWWEQATYRALLKCKTEEEAARQFCLLFERPANKHKRATERAIVASKMMDGKNIA